MVVPSQFNEENVESIRIYHFVEELVASFKNYIDEEFIDDDISMVELPFLLRIRFSDKGSQKDLVNLFKVSDGYTAKLLRRFELAGLIKRIEDPSNRRRKLVKLTDKGLKRTDKILKSIDYWEDAVMDGMNDDEKKVLKKALLKLVLNTEKL
ncbi:DNA-binding transcriptional regulator, MarR family [Methanobrevibacter olleyae]|uniref:DNA-binding transcriptional regulator, MarR family n=1 Tax=Methanobrevibacter olleyae TaxID=294671 RepID=A0A1I4GRQ4_METOL|nr:winged helix DNA-binding protein [Methanobrevibacter olleyae]SFL32180.1 DNA-binding transcriptional regulator, MarR family [Methanobrevibacter olleyae]